LPEFIIKFLQKRIRNSEKEVENFLRRFSVLGNFGLTIRFDRRIPLENWQGKELKMIETKFFLPWEIWKSKTLLKDLQKIETTLSNQFLETKKGIFDRKFFLNLLFSIKRFAFKFFGDNFFDLK